MPDSVPSGLVFFARPSTRRQRRIRSLFLAIWLCAVLALTAPGYLPFSGTFPLVLGLPLSLAWVVLWLFILFAAQLWLYRIDEGRGVRAEG